MHRRIPYSGKKKKEQLRAKRAKKRGDVEDPEASSTPHGAKMNHRRRIGVRGHRAPVSGPSAATKASRRLQSSFVRLPRDFLDETRHLADNLPLPTMYTYEYKRARTQVNEMEYNYRSHLTISQRAG